jgi:hypothetical protein
MLVYYIISQEIIQPIFEVVVRICFTLWIEIALLIEMNFYLIPEIVKRELLLKIQD